VSKSGLTIDTSNFNRAVQEMARLTGASYEDIVKAEIGATLAAAIKNTKAATRASIKKSTEKGVWIPDKNHPKYKGGRIVPPNWKMTSEQWAWLTKNLEEKYKRAGLLKQSWLKIIKETNSPIPKNATISPKAESATVRGKKMFIPTTYNRQVSGSKVGYNIANYAKAATQWGPAKMAFIRAINGRVGYFHRNVRAGVFKKVSTIAKKYPGFKVRGI
jgi:hypothetical protein